MSELLRTEAKTCIEIWVTCPHCEEYQNRFEELRYHFDVGDVRANSCEAEIKCEECDAVFIVEEITF